MAQGAISRPIDLDSYKKEILEKEKNCKGYWSFNIPQSLILIITSRCDFNCKHCFRDRKDVKDLSFEIAQKTILEAKKYNLKHVGLSGGEPFLYPKCMDLIELIAKNNYTFSIVTNGWNFAKFADLLMYYRDRIAYIKFSLESNDRKIHDSLRRDGSFDKLIEDFQICEKYKIPFRTITTVSHINYDQVFDIGVFAKKQGASAVVFSTMLPCARTQEGKFILSAKKRQELFLNLRQSHKIIGLPVIISREIRGYSNIAICNVFKTEEVTVGIDGNLVHCCTLSDYDYIHPASEIIVTSLRDKTFGEALEKLYEYIYKLNCTRIKEYERESDTENIDFNSCFYCIRPKK